MKAVLLAAGKGERLRGTLEEIPKPMIIFRGKPILQHNIELCKRHGIEELYINTHHLAGKIKDYFGDGSKLGVNITYSFEPELLGTSGALDSFREFLRNDDFYVIYGDNYSDYDLGLLRKAFKAVECAGVVAFHHREDVSQSGVGEFADNGRIVRFLEKPGKGMTDSHWVNAGIYYLSSDVLEHIPAGFSDFGKDIFPRLLAEGVPLYSVRSTAHVAVFDTPELLRASLGGTDDSEG